MKRVCAYCRVSTRSTDQENSFENQKSYFERVIAENEEYEYELDDELELKEQPMLPETKAILFNLFRDYLATPEQKAKIIKMQSEARQKNELKKQQMYNTDVFANKPKENLTENNNETTQIVEYKESIFRRILNKIKSFFIKNT